MALLVDYDWPGNVRELENVIQKAIILTDDDTIGPEHLPEDLQQPDLLGLGDSLPAASFEDQLRDYKVKLAQKAVAECNGNKTLAARSLHISRTYLHRLIKDFMEEETPEVRADIRSILRFTHVSSGFPFRDAGLDPGGSGRPHRAFAL